MGDRADYDYPTMPKCHAAALAAGPYHFTAIITSLSLNSRGFRYCNSASPVTGDTLIKINYYYYSNGSQAPVIVSDDAERGRFISPYAMQSFEYDDEG